MSQTHDEIRALRLMVEELQAEPVPELPWDAIEQRLLSRIVAHPHPGARPGARSDEQSPLGAVAGGSGGVPRLRSPLVRVFGFAAAAAVLALGIGSIAGSGAMPAAATIARHRVEVAAVAFEPGSAQVRDLSALRAGDVVEAGDTPIRFGRAGLATWALTAGSAVRVVSTGEASQDGVGFTVALERGAIRAEVTPRDPAEGLVEAFAVEVGGTRVAVHGTAFSVKIEGNRAIVDVEHGAVAVGPVGYVGVTTGHLLVGPSRASFSLDGGRSARLLGRAQALLAAGDLDVAETASADTAPMAPSKLLATQPVTMGGDPPYPPAQPVAVAAADAPSPTEVRGAPAALRPHAAPGAAADKAEAHPAAAQPAAPEAPAEPPRLTVAAVQQRMLRCFRQQYSAGSSSGNGFSFSTAVHIEVNDDGSVRSMRLTPAAPPEVQSCVGGSIFSGRFPENAGHQDFPFSFRP